MHEQVLTPAKRPTHPAVLALAGRFGKYKPEEEKEVRKIDVKEDKVLKQLKAAWRKFKHIGPPNLRRIEEIYEYPYRHALKQVKGIRYSARDVESFTLALIGFQREKNFSEKAGYFLSALINNCRDTDYVVHTQHLVKEINYLGFKNTKNVVVNGNIGHSIGKCMKRGSITLNCDVGERVGWDMKGGTITVNGNADVELGCGMEGGTIIVNGNAGYSLGFAMRGGIIILNGNADSRVGEGMEGGTIVVNGNVDWQVGDGMHSGTITVNGHAGEKVGQCMNGGEIHLNGDYESLAAPEDIFCGKIFHKGKRIVNKKEKH